MAPNRICRSRIFSGSPAKCACGMLYLNTRTPMTQQIRSGLTTPLSCCGNLSGNELTRNFTGNIWPQSSQLAEPLWTDPVTKSGITVRELISTLKKKKKAQTGNEWLYILPKSSQARKMPPVPFYVSKSLTASFYTSNACNVAFLLQSSCHS